MSSEHLAMLQVGPRLAQAHRDVQEGGPAEGVEGGRDPCATTRLPFR
jgi:hypothetical protein